MTTQFNGHIPFTPIIIDDFTSAPILQHTQHTQHNNTNNNTTSSTTNSTPLAFFLTHYHKDHIRGLTQHFTRGHIYTTKVTRALLLIDLPRLRPFIRTIDVEEKTAITLTSSHTHTAGYTFYVTAFDANHCPGAVVLLFHLPTTTTTTATATAAAAAAAVSYRAVLHTGDMRYDPLRFHSPLLLSAVNHIDTLYLDCTFFHTSTACFPTKHTAIHLLTRLIAAYLSQHTTQYTKSTTAAYHHPLLHPRIYLAADMLGTEELLLSLFAHFNQRMYVSRDGWDRYRQLALLKRTLPLLTDQQHTTPFTVCAARSFQQFKRDMDGRRDAVGGVQALYVKPSTMWFSRLSERRKGGKMQSTSHVKPQPAAAATAKAKKEEEEEADDIVDAEADWAEASSGDVCGSDWVARDSAGVVHLCWSMHSGMSECLHFIQLLQPRYVIPITPPAALVQPSDQHTDFIDDDCTATTAAAVGDSTLQRTLSLSLSRKRAHGSRSSSSSSGCGSSLSLAERDQLVVSTLQRYIDSLLPNRRVVVRSPVTAAEAEATAESNELSKPHCVAADVVPDTPERLQGVKRVKSSPCKLPSSVSGSTAAVKAVAVKAEVKVETCKVESVKAEHSIGGGSGSGSGSADFAGGGRVSRSLFSPGVSSAMSITRAQSTLLVVREELSRSAVVWKGAATAVSGVTAQQQQQQVKDEKVSVAEELPVLIKD